MQWLLVSGGLYWGFHFSLNPVKQLDNFGEIFEVKEFLEKYMKENCSSEHNQ